MRYVYVALCIRHCVRFFKPKQIMYYDNRMEKFGFTPFQLALFLTENQSRNNWRQIQA